MWLADYAEGDVIKMSINVKRRFKQSAATIVPDNFKNCSFAVVFFYGWEEQTDRLWTRVICALISADQNENECRTGDGLC